MIVFIEVLIQIVRLDYWTFKKVEYAALSLFSNS